MKWTTEAKVGAFTILGLILFVSSIVFVGKMDIFAKPEMAITGQFEQVNGLKTGNQVKLSGVAVGTVDSVEIVPGGVAVGMKINEGTEIPSDSKFMMGADGLLGDKFIQISPGKSKVYLHDGDSVRGEGADSMDKAMQSAQKLMEGTEKMLRLFIDYVKHNLHKHIKTIILSDNAKESDNPAIKLAYLFEKLTKDDLIEIDEYNDVLNKENVNLISNLLNEFIYNYNNNNRCAVVYSENDNKIKNFSKIKSILEKISIS